MSTATPPSIGRFKILRELGRGGMGVVYLAEDPGRKDPVALKVLTRGFSSSALRHFEQEFHILTGLDHPNLTEVYDFGRVTEQGEEAPFFTMEFVDGETLDHHFDSLGRELDRLPGLLAQLGHALAYLHGRGLVHQDVKPSNVLVTSAGRVKLMDLGLASTGHEGAGAGRVRGTVAYLSPEAARGEGVDPRSDLYSLGCMAYQLVAGRPPFRGDSALGVLRGHLEEAPLAPSTLNPETPSPLEALILRLLAKEPANRPQSADRFLHELNEVAGGALTIESADTRRTRVLGGGFVGRSAELERLLRQVRDARGGHGRMVFLVGEAGVGKSRLLRELQVQSQLDGFDLYIGRPRESQSALADALDRALLDRRADASFRERLAPLLGEEVEGSDRKIAGAPQLASVLSEILSDLSRDKPIGLALEDLHLADETTCTLLASVMERLADAPGDRPSVPLLIVAAYRGDEVSRATPLFELLEGARRVDQVVEEQVLEPLSAEETDQLVRSQCGASTVPPAFLERILEETRGNPLHIGELLALLAEEGHLRPGAENPFGSSALQNLELPRRIHDLLARRLERAGDEPIAVLRAGAILGGMTLDPEAIAAVTGLRWEHVVGRFLELRAAGLLEREQVEGREPEYRLVHPVLAGLALESMPAGEQKELHARAVSYLERRRIPRRHGAWRSLARHAEAAGQPGRAIEAYRRAADLACDLAAHREAIADYSTAIDLALRQPATPATVLCELYQRRGDTRALTGDLRRAEEDYRWMLARAEKSGEQHLKAWAHLSLGDVLAAGERHSEAQDELEVALDIAERVEEPAVIARSQLALGEILARQDRFEEGIRFLDAAAEAARGAEREDLAVQTLLRKGVLLREHGDLKAALACYEAVRERIGDRAAPSVEVSIDEGTAVALEVQGDLGGALEACRRARKRAQELGDTRRSASLSIRVGRLLSMRGDMNGADEELRDALQRHRDLGLREGLASTLHALSRLQARRGRFAEATRNAREALELCRRLDRRDLTATSLMLLGGVDRDAGDPERAASRLEEADRMMSGSRNLQWHPGFLLELATLRHLQRNYDEAMKLFQESAFLSRRAGDPRREARAFCGLGEAHLSSNDFDRARVAVRKALRLVESGEFGHEVSLARLLRARIELALPGGDLVSAELDAGTALETFRQLQQPEWVWQAEHLVGRAQLRLGRRSDAIERLQRAHRYVDRAHARLDGRFRRTFLEHPARRELIEDWKRLRVEAAEEIPREEKVESGELARSQNTIEALEGLLDLNRKFLSVESTDALLDAILESALRHSGAERALLLIRDDDGEVELRRGRSGDGQPLGTEDERYSRSIVQATISRGSALSASDAEADSRFSGFESVHELRIRSVLSVPLPDSGGTTGALYLDTRMKRRGFSVEQETLIGRLAVQAALALGHAALLERLAEQKQSVDRLNRELQKTIAAQRDELAEVREALSFSRTSIEMRYRFEDIVGGSPVMQRVYHVIERLAPKRLPVLIIGESGTGKELIARALHTKSDRSSGPFFTVNCAAVSETLLESELFGYRKGAFTGADRDKPGYFELADGGTLFLDEIGEMGQAMQAKLLRAIERGEVMPVGGKTTSNIDVRIVCATHRDLPAMIAEGGFREDLYYRVNVGRVDVPPLRQRLDDVPLLIDHFLARQAEQEGIDPLELEPAALKALRQHQWPGNVRELQHQLMRVATFAKGKVITVKDLARYADLPSSRPGSPAPAQDDRSVVSLEEVERRQIQKALESAGGNKTKAAELLGINRATLFRKLKRYGI